jgi:hypothetical protein
MSEPAADTPLVLLLRRQLAEERRLRARAERRAETLSNSVVRLREKNAERLARRVRQVLDARRT